MTRDVAPLSTRRVIVFDFVRGIAYRREVKRSWFRFHLIRLGRVEVRIVLRPSHHRRRWGIERNARGI